jgi:hypothetical protein
LPAGSLRSKRHKTYGFALGQTFVRAYLGDIEVEASGYHEAAVEAERSVRRDYVEDKGEEGSLIAGQYTYVVEAEVRLGDPNSSYENTRFLELASPFIEDSRRSSRSKATLFGMVTSALRAGTFTNSLLRARRKAKGKNCGREPGPSSRI